MRRGVLVALAAAVALSVSAPAFAFQKWTCTVKDSKGASFSSYYDGIFEQSSKRVATEEAMDKCKAASKDAKSCTFVTCVRPS